jgi:16S rRNA (guanine527-N7)-methyltransferase
MQDNIKNIAESIDLDLNPNQTGQISIYLRELLKANKNINLIGDKKEEDIINKHIYPALFLAKSMGINKTDSFKVVDIGAGSGILGVIIRIFLPDIEISFIESIKKKADFIKNVITLLGLSKSYIINERIEKIGQDISHREIYNAVVARAVAPLNILCEYSLPFLKENGRLYALKGSLWKKEIETSQKAFSVIKLFIIPINLV